MTEQTKVTNEQRNVTEEEVTYLKEADFYDEIMSEFPFVEEMMEEIIVEIRNIKKSNLILDFGMGTGTIMKKMSEMDNLKIIGIDQNKYLLQKAREKLKDVKNCGVIQGNILEYKNDSPADIIIATETYHHIQDKDKITFLKNIYDNLKYDGLLIIGDEFIGKYENDEGKKESIKNYYALCFDYINKIGVSGNTSQALEEAYNLSLKGVEELKVSFEIFQEQLLQSGFALEKVSQIWPRKEVDFGCKIIVARKK